MPTSTSAPTVVMAAHAESEPRSGSSWGRMSCLCWRRSIGHLSRYVSMALECVVLIVCGPIPGTANPAMSTTHVTDADTLAGVPTGDANPVVSTLTETDAQCSSEFASVAV